MNSMQLSVSETSDTLNDFWVKHNKHPNTSAIRLSVGLICSGSNVKEVAQSTTAVANDTSANQDSGITQSMVSAVDPEEESKKREQAVIENVQKQAMAMIGQHL